MLGSLDLVVDFFLGLVHARTAGARRLRGDHLGGLVLLLVLGFLFQLLALRKEGVIIPARDDGDSEACRVVHLARELLVVLWHLGALVLLHVLPRWLRVLAAVRHQLVTNDAWFDQLLVFEAQVLDHFALPLRLCLFALLLRHGLPVVEIQANIARLFAHGFRIQVVVDAVGHKQNDVVRRAGHVVQLQVPEVGVALAGERPQAAARVAWVVHVAVAKGDVGHLQCGGADVVSLAVADVGAHKRELALAGEPHELLLQLHEQTADEGRVPRLPRCLLVRDDGLVCDAQGGQEQAADALRVVHFGQMIHHVVAERVHTPARSLQWARAPRAPVSHSGNPPAVHQACVEAVARGVALAVLVARQPGVRGDGPPARLLKLCDDVLWGF
mmetsp:Transcript_46930/g.118250  ORF Transcript_46930/g.118250 Transcript_46930/m.118250 type:complete len:385 (+) Transcript_46930:502-1656(+)